MLAFIAAIIIDMFVIDTIIVIYAYSALNTPFLQFLAFRGFYLQIDPHTFILLPQLEDAADKQQLKKEGAQGSPTINNQ